MSLEQFHPTIQRWFAQRFGEPTEPQRDGWPRIVSGRNVLISAPTGTGKTIAGYLAAIDRLARQGAALRDKTEVLYVSPLRALSNDMHRNLEVPLAEIASLAEAEGLAVPAIRAGLRKSTCRALDGGA